MKKLLLTILFALTLAANSVRAENLYVFADVYGAAFLTNESCSQRDIVANVPADVIMKAQRFYVQYTALGQKETGTSILEGCYIIEEGFVHWINERGQTGWAELREFSKLKVESI